MPTKSNHDERPLPPFALADRHDRGRARLFVYPDCSGGRVVAV
jgi:hypothetical protein